MKLAAVFSGQGVQYIGMGKELYERYECCRQLFDTADRILGWSLKDICFNGPETELTKTDKCQPAIFVVSACAYKAFIEESNGKINFSAMAGLSLGEWTALWASGAVSFEDCLKILEARGRFMQEACELNKGGMVSIIGLDLNTVINIAKESCVEVANINSPEQIVISGDSINLQQASRKAEEMGAKKVVPLKVAGAYHSKLMLVASNKFKDFLESINFSKPSLPVMSNFSGEPHTQTAIKDAMVKQIVSSVRWLDNVKFMIDRMKINTFIEFGPGKVLSGLIRRIDKNAILYDIYDTQSLNRTLIELKERING